MKRFTWASPLLTLGLMAAGVAHAQVDTQLPDPVEQGATPMDRMEMGGSEAGRALVAPPPAPEASSPFIRDSNVSGQVRSYYFNRDKYEPSRSEAWALGGSLGIQSGYLGNLLRFGAVAYTSQPLYAPDDRDGTGLLKPGQEGYAVLGQIYGEVKFTERIFGAFGRKEYDTPYLNRNDTRMTPNTFEGVTVYGKAGGTEGAPAWRFGGGYISKIKEKNSDEFKWMSTVAGAPVERGVHIAGANVDTKEFSLGAIDYYSDDVINIFYTEGAFSPALGAGLKLKLAAQFTDQRGTGDELLTGSAFSTRQWGIKADMSIAGAVFTLAYTDTAKGDNIRSPWSGHPGYTSVQVKDFNRAGESAMLVKAAYDFGRHGMEGLSAYALWVHGAGVAAPAYNEDEVDLNVQWKAPKASALRGTSVRVRYAHIDQRGGGDPTINDFRIIVNYDF